MAWFGNALNTLEGAFDKFDQAAASKLANLDPTLAYSAEDGPISHSCLDSEGSNDLDDNKSDSSTFSFTRKKSTPKFTPPQRKTDDDLFSFLAESSPPATEKVVPI